MSTRGTLWSTALIVALAVPAHVIGLAVPGIYRDPAIVVPQNIGTDLVTLFIMLPVLVAGATAAVRGSLRGRLVWFGALGYMAYAYGMYALGVRWNELFLVYVALFGLSTFTLALGLAGTNAVSVRAALRDPAKARAAAAYLVAIAIAAGGMWVSEELGALLRGVVPASVRQFETPTNIVHVFDLGLVLPAIVVAAVWLLRDRPWGYVLAAVLLVKATSIGLWVVAMIAISARAGYAVPPAYAGFFVLLTLIGAGLTWRFLDASLRPRAF